MTPRPPFRRNPNFKPLCYEIDVVLDFEGIATPEELDGEPLQQMALLLAYRESGRMRVLIWAHENMMSDWQFEAAFADSRMGGMDEWSDEEFCDYLAFLSRWKIGTPISFIEGVSDFDPVPEFSRKAQEILAISELDRARKAGEMVH
ncbi:MAG TPA: hypothetical protein GXX48_13030 [Ochrobactrum intermedium]|uniref:Uncharacterized protein n=1 Tax=Brucella intermedia TaxID=94625 RepID=A0A7V6PCS4_9HYPH|nr:hypothetical protein [Brucella intermedia]HHV68553.1 hypothetical protein [Brucella intermedia]